jgi:F0F1-type ATP synthase membrane subunit b/b'
VRGFFIAFGLALFLGYCGISVAYQNRVAIPDLRDASGIDRLLARGYRLRDGIENPDRSGGPPLYPAGRPLGREMLDRLRELGIGAVTVVGHGTPVGFLAGTAVMVAVIFLTLTAALKPILWDPFAALLEKRGRELAEGEENERKNAAEAGRLERERLRLKARVDREIREARLRGNREAASQVMDIVREAREKGKGIKADGLREMALASGEAETELDRRIPLLAEAIAEALTPGKAREEGVHA